MSATIQIDDEVKTELEKWAYKYGLSVFSTPNDVLRIMLGLNSEPNSKTSQATRQQPSNHPSVVAPTNINIPLSPFSGTRKKIGSRLLREHPFINAQRGYFSTFRPTRNTPYQFPSAFPAVFFDPEGYFIVDSEDSMRDNPHIRVGKQVNVLGGISSIPGYVRCGHTHE